MSHYSSVALGLTGGTRPAVRDSRGDLHVVYSKNWFPESSNVYYSRSTDDGATWSQPIDISRDGYAVSVNATLAIDSRDGLHCVWFQEFNVGGQVRYDYCYAAKVDSEWTTPVNVSRIVSTSNAAYQSCVAVGPDDGVHVAFEIWDSSSCGVWCSRQVGDSWLLPALVSGRLQHSPQPALTASPDGKLHLCWREFRGDSAYILYSCHDTAWSSPRDIAASPAWAGWPCLAAAADGTVHLGFDGDDGSGTTDVFYMCLRNGEWTSPVNLSGTWDRSSWSSAVAVDGNCAVYFCWSEETAPLHNEIMYRWHATDWSGTVALTAEPLMSSWVPRFIERAAPQGPNLFWVGSDTIPDWCPIYEMELSLASSVSELTLNAHKPMPGFPTRLSTGALVVWGLDVRERYRVRVLDMCARAIYERHAVRPASDGSIRCALSDRDQCEMTSGVYFVQVASARGTSVQRFLVVR
jgi:hypothetical protein